MSLLDAFWAADFGELVCLVELGLEDVRCLEVCCLVDECLEGCLCFQIDCCFADVRLAEACLVLVDCLDEAGCAMVYMRGGRKKLQAAW